MCLWYYACKAVLRFTWEIEKFSVVIFRISYHELPDTELEIILCHVAKDL